MRVRDQLRRAREDRSGAVALIFALALLPVVAMGGAAVDYSRAQTVATVLQSALDAAAIAAANKGPELSEGEIEALARRTIEQRLGDASRAVLTDVRAVRRDETISLSGNARVATAFMRVVGIGEMTVSREAWSAYGTQHIDIALVLDNTGSMGGAKIRELKRALCGDASCGNPSTTSGFVGIMREAARRPERVRVGLVPFETSVRMPLSVEQAVASAPQTSATFPSPGGGGYCTGGARSDSATRVGWFRFADRDRNTVGGDRGCKGSRPTPTTWGGCVWDRDQRDDLDVTDADLVATDVRTLHPAVDCRVESLARIMPLADIWTDNRTIVEAMSTMEPSGNTNVTIGVAWGRALLTGAEPFTEAASLPAGVRPQDVLRYMIVLTDGDNTENKARQGRGAMDERTRDACEEAKEAGITVITVRVIAGNRNLLRDCASAPDLYYEVNQASQLTAAFREIAERIGSVRLTQ